MSDSSNSLSDPASSVILHDDQLKAYTADLELTHAIFWGPSKIDLYLGGRYAGFFAGQSIDVEELPTHASPFSYADASSQFSFYGGGLTAGLQGHTPLGWARELNLIWGVRGSVLWGEAERRIQDVAVIDGASAAAGGITDNSATAYIIEALLGLEWKHELRWLPMSTYLRVAFEYQYWNLGSAGSSSKFASTPGLPLPPTPTPSATASSSIGDVSMNLIGLNIGAGLNW
jgi:hypothetical protein